MQQCDMADPGGASRWVHRSERYREHRNKLQRIPATWVGPTEATQGKIRYRVILDK